MVKGVFGISFFVTKNVYFWSLDSDSLALGVYGVGARPPGWRMGGSTESVVDQHTLGEGNSDFKTPYCLAGYTS